MRRPRSKDALDATLNQAWFKVEDIARKRQTMDEIIRRLQAQQEMLVAEEEHGGNGKRRRR